MEIAKTLQFLARLRPTTTGAELLFSPASAQNNKSGEQVVLRTLYVANVSSSNVKYSVYFDHDGSVASKDTALVFEATIEKNTTEPIELRIPMNNSAGQLQVQIDSANDVNFQLMGDK